MPQIDATARVATGAELADDVAVGPYAIIEAGVRIGPGTSVGSHSVIAGNTEIGARNRIGPHVILGTPPQDHTYRGEPTRLLIGDDNTFREFATVNRGTLKGGGITLIGSHNLLMTCSHVGHDCFLGDHNILSNNALLAGHVKLEGFCLLSGHTAVHQFVTVGRLAMLGGLTGVARDVPPFVTMLVDPRVPKGVNVIGMRRAGYSEEEVRSVQRAFRPLFGGDTSRVKAVEDLERAGGLTGPLREMVEFIKRSERGVLGRFLEITRS